MQQVNYVPPVKGRFVQEDLLRDRQEDGKQSFEEILKKQKNHSELKNGSTDTRYNLNVVISQSNYGRFINTYNRMGRELHSDSDITTDLQG